MPVRQVKSWAEATKSNKTRVWKNVEIEAQNQLTVFLHTNAHSRYQRWNHLVKEFKQEILTPLVEERLAIAMKHLGLDTSIRDCAMWDILGALMENAYLDCGHRVFFFLELLGIYEAGHFPCGWEGKWPSGTLLVF
jgi:predicted TIM-barrel fold metal-dependent hydrolase